jgi:hypothetical protein
MAGIIYKKLFEVQLLHEYYLTHADETTVFDNLNNKDAFLTDNFNNGVPSVSDDLQYLVPQAIQDVFDNFHLRIVPSYAGFSVLTEVTQNVLSNGTIVYKPLVQIPATVNLLVQLSLKNNLLASVTNKRINKNIPAIYLFTNEDIPSAKTFPVLSAGVPVFDSSYAYEQGELYADSSGKIGIFYMNGSTKDFLPVNGDGYANTSDELLVPIQFTYRFNATDNVTKANFDLKDHTGKTVRSYVFARDLPIKKQLINFSGNQNPGIVDPPDDPIASLPFSVVSAETVYSLSVTINDTVTIVQKLIFFDGDDALTDCWGMVSIKPQVTNTEYNLYDAAGLILFRKKGDGTIDTPAPVFELRIKSRATFWRYINDRNGVLKAGISPSFLQRDGTRNLASLVPRNSSAVPRMFTKKDNSGKITEQKFLPNPETDGQITIEGQKMYTDILVPNTSLFPLDTS